MHFQSVSPSYLILRSMQGLGFWHFFFAHKKEEEGKRLHKKSIKHSMTPFACTTTKTFTFSSSSSSWTRRERRRERSLSGSFSSCSSNSSSLSSSFNNGRNFAQNRRHFQRSEKKKTTTQIKANIEDYDIVPKSGGKAKGGFVGGLLIGGAIFGALGFLFAPQLSKHILKGKKVLDDLLEEEEEEEEESWTEEKETNATSSSSIKLEKRAEKELEETRKSLNQKIAELNKAIDEFSDEADVRLNAKLGRLSEELDSAEARSF